MKTKIKIILVLFLALISIIGLVYLLFLNYYQGKIYPGVKISFIPVSGLTPQNSRNLLEEKFQTNLATPLQLSFQEQTFTLNLKDTQPELNLNQVVTEAYGWGRSQNFWQDFVNQTQALLYGKNFIPDLSYHQPSQLTSQINQIDQLIKIDKIEAQIKLEPQITVVPSVEGIGLDVQLLSTQVKNYLTLMSPPPSTLPTKVIQPDFSTLDAQNYQNILEKVKINPLKLKFENQSWIIDQKTLFSLLSFTPEKSTPTPIIQTLIGQNIKPQTPIFQGDKLQSFIQNIAKEIDQDSQDAKFNVDQTTSGSVVRVKEFIPSQEGRKLDVGKTTELLNQALADNTFSEINLPVSITQPKITMSNINNFGIKELLGQGLSYFSGSIANRIYNIGLASSRLNGTLIAPGDIFSFNQVVGEISGATGYKQAYVIKSGRTVLDDGGGVCQVSTTLFRAILNSGLPIVARTAHAYRVGYYEQSFPPGLDATVFAPTVDFQFKNDTPAYLLIQAYTQGLSLIINIYGTTDGRVAILSTPLVTNQTPPPAELRQDDPTLPKGEVKQVDWSAWGANVSFTRMVKRGSETLISETFKSYYKPWQAIFLVGTKE